MAASARTKAFIILLFDVLAFGAANFLREGPTFLNERLSIGAVKSALQKEIDAAMGHNTSHDTLASIEKDFRSMFAALPKNQFGNLGPSTARYALNRAFLRRHGWQVRGLEPTSGSFNSSSPTGVLTDKVPRYIEDLFEQRLNGRGFGLHELAVFTATIEHLISNEALGRLQGAFKMLRLPEDKPLSSEQMDSVLSAYMMVSVLGANLSSMTEAEFAKAMVDVKEAYPAWPETQEFAKEIKRQIIYAPFTLFTKVGYDFATTDKVAKAVAEGFGKFQDKECQAIKNDLLQSEDRGSGRVKLGDFYAQDLGEVPRFSESPDYLRELNVLDESDKGRPRVMVANYLAASSNCIGSSGLYSTCCSNECEAIMGHLERKIGEPTAAPKHIAKLIAALPSSTVAANRQLQPSMYKHLDMIAARHNGRVPLHSRLFAQWLHHAYPRECPFPNPVGKSRPMNEQEWFEAKGVGISATAEEMQRARDAQANNMTSDERMIVEIGREELEDMPWTTEEEEVVVQESWKHADFSFMSILRNLCFIGMIAASWAYILDTLGVMCASRGKVFPGKPDWNAKPNKAYK